MSSPAILATELSAAAATSAPATLLLPARAAVVVGGVPGAGKTTLLDRVARASRARVLDSADVRARIRGRLGPRVPYAAFRPLVHVLHLLAVWHALGDRGDAPVVVHDCATRRAVRRAMLRRARAAGRPVVLLALDVAAHEARGGQRAAGGASPTGRCAATSAAGARCSTARPRRCWPRASPASMSSPATRPTPSARCASRLRCVTIRRWARATTTMTTGWARRPRAGTAAIGPSPSSGVVSGRSCRRWSASSSSS